MSRSDGIKVDTDGCAGCALVILALTIGIALLRVVERGFHVTVTHEVRATRAE